ncbi:MAG TPA: hypothetical protein VNL98_10980 [Gemmatimonadales bacterium]|nr:hypothetical protein [Gemmatimonadales bacterium]
MKSISLLLCLAALTACERGSVPLYDNLGSYHRAITTSSERAQAYFDQGMRLTWAFNHAEAIRAFREAARLDPECAMCFWGIALAYGPNINIPMDSAGEQEAFAAIQRAIQLRANASELERALIDALARRYGETPLANRPARDSAWAEAMRLVLERWPDDNDAGVLFADAMMNLRPWNYWMPDGRPFPGTGVLVAALERVIARDSTHPGACHLYIHAVEKVQPERAVPCAERLASLMPGAGHLVHMPAHIYFRVGRYADAVAANEHASHADSSYIEGQRPGGVYPMFYTPHNHHFRAAAAMMEGRYQAALAAARETARLAPLENVRAVPPLELYVPVPLYVMARFGRWSEILREPAPPAELLFTTGVWYYARALAYAATGHYDSARIAADSLVVIADDYPAEATIGLNSGRSLLHIAMHALEGELAARAARNDEAIRHLQQAITIEDQLTYDEPPPWYYPVRHSLGAVLLTAGRAREAEAVYLEDLRRYPENGWSLVGLREALRVQGRSADAAAVDTRFRRAWARADTPISASRL